MHFSVKVAGIAVNAHQRKPTFSVPAWNGVWQVRHTQTHGLEYVRCRRNCKDMLGPFAARVTTWNRRARGKPAKTLWVFFQMMVANTISLLA